MTSALIYIGIGLMVIGFLWGLILAFQRRTLTGILTLLTFPIGILFFLLFIRPEGFQRPTALLGIGLALTILAGFFQ